MEARAGLLPHICLIDGPRTLPFDSIKSFGELWGELIFTISLLLLFTFAVLLKINKQEVFITSFVPLGQGNC